MIYTWKEGKGKSTEGQENKGYFSQYRPRIRIKISLGMFN